LNGADSLAIDKAVRALKSDLLVAIPTETVYGLAARASSPNAVKKIFTIKGRPTEHPLILHVAKTQDLTLWSSDLLSAAHALAEKYWPGPLTLVVRRNNKVCDEITGGRDTVAIRCPSHPITTVASASGESRASGMLEKHYAPNCTVELASSRKDAELRLANLKSVGRIAEILDFGADLEMYAHDLYSRLRDADRRLVDVVIAVKPAMTGIGIAVNERLKKASNSASCD